MSDSAQNNLGSDTDVVRTDSEQHQSQGASNQAEKRVPADDVARSERHVWLAVLVGLCLWVAWRIGAFDLTTSVTVNGRSVTVPNVYAWVDHPFHATRGHVLLESLRQGEILRWVGNHQGGYPAEFYPLGAAWLDVVLWTLFLGTKSIIALHKLAVVVVFLIPAASYWILARGDRIHPGIAVLAAAVHFAVPGTWLNGGYTELVEWGLITNVAGSSLAVLASAALARFVLHGEHGMGVLAILAAAGGACTNPRALFAVVIASIAIVAVASASQGPPKLRYRVLDATARVGGVGTLAVMLAAPVVFALFRYNAEYFFLHYEFYDPLSKLWDASVMATTRGVLVLAVLGALLAIAQRSRSISRALALTLGLYVLFTVWVATSSWVPPLVEQLEAPRLMPFQRQLVIWFGAIAVWFALQRLVSWVPAIRHWRLESGLYGVLAVAFLVALVRPMGFVPVEFHGLREVGTTGDADFTLFQDAIIEADSLHDDGTSIFVIANRPDWWHEQLWGPTASNAPFYYDDWMWYWTRTHQGPYDYHNGHYFPDPTEALTEEYLAGNGISVVVVTDMMEAAENPRDAARFNPLLNFEDTIGLWDIYTVVQPTSLLTNGDELPTEIDVRNEVITAHFNDGDGNVVIKRNWFPRWEVFADGEEVQVIHRADGYMEVSVPAGPVDIEVRYGVTTMDWVARASSIVGVAGVLMLAVAGKRWFSTLPGVR